MCVASRPLLLGRGRTGTDEEAREGASVRGRIDTPLPYPTSSSLVPRPSFPRRPTRHECHSCVSVGARGGGNGRGRREDSDDKIITNRHTHTPSARAVPGEYHPCGGRDSWKRSRTEGGVARWRVYNDSDEGTTVRPISTAHHRTLTGDPEVNEGRTEGKSAGGKKMDFCLVCVYEAARAEIACGSVAAGKHLSVQNRSLVGLPRLQRLVPLSRHDPETTLPNVASNIHAHDFARRDQR